MPKSKDSAEERRRARRTLVRESFNLFLVIPEVHGMVRIYMRDISRVGLCFRTEMEGDFRSGQKFKARMYLNPAFYLPLECKVIRVSGGEVAVEFPEAGAGQAIARLQEFFDTAEEHGVLAE
jgi:hypothetical protein